MLNDWSVEDWSSSLCLLYNFFYRWVAINFCFTSLIYVAISVRSSYEYDPKMTAAKILLHW